MSDNRPTEWQWRTPDEDWRIDGLTRQEWEQRGVHAWITRYIKTAPLLQRRGETGPFASLNVYAPASEEFLPAVWPARLEWQWRKLDRDMDDSTWHAVQKWIPGNDGVAPEHGLCSCRGALANVAKAGEWWAPADQDGNPCDWPEVGPPPVVVIPAAEMTPQGLYGHQAMGGTWRYSHRDCETWSRAQDWHYGAISATSLEQWTPCDEHGNFCELRRVVSDTACEVERRKVDDGDQRIAWLAKQARHAYDEADRTDARIREVTAERDEWKRRAEKAVRHVRELEEAIHYAYRAMACAEANE